MKKKTRTITIAEPPFWHAHLEEKYFFMWLQRIPAFQTMEASVDGIKITVTWPIDDNSLHELIALHSRYQLDLKCLRPLCHEKNENRLKNSSKPSLKATFAKR